MMRWILGKYYARLRRLDIEVLWPDICRQATDILEARVAFRVHADCDPAWMFLGPAKIDEIIGGLEWTAFSENFKKS
jgi:hypothetical protein